MKKILFLIVLCAFVSISTSALAEAEITGTGTTIGSVIFQPSSGTLFFADATTTAYACASKHIGGDQVYTSDETNPGIDETQSTKGFEITSSAGAAE